MTITIEENRFGFEPEITAKVAKSGLQSFRGSAFRIMAERDEEGKKIGWRDGVRELFM